jgi:hypothetical protein
MTRQYYVYKINRRALPFMFQIMRFGYRQPDKHGFQSARAVFTIGYSKATKSFVLKLNTGGK